MKKILALLMVLAMLIPTAAPAFAACSHPKDAIETEYGKMDVLHKPIDAEKHRTTIIFGEYRYCTLCDEVVGDWKETEREVYEQNHELENNECWLCGYKPGSLKPSKVVLEQSGTVTLPMGETLALGYAVEPNGASTDVKWSTSAKKIAVVDENGVVMPVKEGTATITVKTANGKKDTVKVKVVDPYKPAKVVLDASGTVTLKLGEKLELGYKLQPETARAEVKWKSSGKKIAIVDENGIVTPVKEGTATITVTTHNGKKDTVKVKVVDPYKPSKVVLDASGTITLKMGETLQLNAALEPETAKTTLKWTAGSKKIATVTDGMVTPVKEGTVTITVATANGKKDTVKVKVIDPYKPEKVTLNTAKLTMEQGKTAQLTAALYPETAKTTLTWKSSNTKVAKVDELGNITCLKPGNATISVKTANGKTASAKLTVTKVLREDEKIVADVLNALGDDLMAKAKKKGYSVWFQFQYFNGKGFNWQVVIESPANTTYPKYKADLALMQDMYNAILEADVFNDLGSSGKATLQSLPFLQKKSYDRDHGRFEAQISGNGPSNQVLVHLREQNHNGSNKESAWTSSFTWNKCTSYWVRP